MSKQSEIFERISALRLFQEKGLQEALRVFPDHSAYLQSVNSKDMEKEMQRLKDELSRNHLLDKMSSSGPGRATTFRQYKKEGKSNDSKGK